MRSALTWLLLAIVSVPAAAEKHALLIGIDNYQPPIRRLFGSRADVEALRDELIGNQGFKPRNVTLLIDAQATRAAILRELDRLASIVRAGDYVFVHYSGHGTSAFDRTPDRRPRFEGAGLHKLTGALVPFDYSLRSAPGGGGNDPTDGLIIGRRDLRPRFEYLDRSCNVFVTFDTCFSGNSVRSISRRSVRWMNPAPAQRPRSSAQRGSLPDDDAMFGSATARPEPYPYRRLIYISAARKYERAAELTEWETFDRRDHGALTHAILQGLRGAANADLDDVVSYNELYRYVRDEVSQRTQHMPQLLHPESPPDLLQRSVFDQRRRPAAAAAPAVAADTLRVAVGRRLAHLRRNVAALPGVEVVADERGDHHIAVEPQRDGLVALYHPSGDLVAGGFRDRPPQRLLDRIARQAQVQALIDLSYLRPDFDLSLDLSSASGFLLQGQRFDIIARSDRPAVLVLLNVDKTGTVSVLYPIAAGELQAAYELRETFEVVPPYGTEVLKLFAFDRSPPGLERWLNRQIDVLDPSFDELVELLRAPATGRAQTRLKVVSVRELVSGYPGR